MSNNDTITKIHTSTTYIQKNKHTGRGLCVGGRGGGAWLEVAIIKHIGGGGQVGRKEKSRENRNTRGRTEEADTETGNTLSSCT